jgi:hypothetical protein
MIHHHRQDRGRHDQPAAGPLSLGRRWPPPAPQRPILFAYSVLCALALLSSSQHHSQCNQHDKQQQATRFKPLVGLAEAAGQPQTAPTPPLPQAQAQMSSTPNSNSNNLYQALSQMFQVFNGNDSAPLDANHFKLLELADEDTLLVGAR